MLANDVSDNYGYVGPTETAWQTGNATTTSALLDAGGSRLAIKTGTGAVTWLIFDLHGSVVALCTAGTTTLADAYRYDGFAQQIASAGTSSNPWRYRGLLNIGSDALTGALLDMGARDYSAQLGQFTQLDSVQGSAANPLTMDRYLYALANPATLVDPDGHGVCEADPCPGGLIAIGPDPDHSTFHGTPAAEQERERRERAKSGGGGGRGDEACDRECQRAQPMTQTCDPGCERGPDPYFGVCDRGCERLPVETTLSCGGFSEAFGVMVSFQACSGTFGGQRYGFLTWGVGAMTGTGVSLTTSDLRTNAATPTEQGGWFGSFGGSGSAAIVGAGPEWAVGRGEDGRTIWNTSVPYGVNVKAVLPGEIHAQGTFTVYGSGENDPLNILSWLSAPIDWLGGLPGWDAMTP